MISNIVGRAEEQKLLGKILSSQRPEFVAVYGRRRVGKTFLINEFFEEQGCLFEMTGSTKTNLSGHLQRFCMEVCRRFEVTGLDDPIENWDTAFQWLLATIDNVLKSHRHKKIILFFDEIPWLDEGNSGFLPALDYFWNRYISKTKYSRVKIIICGSAASWMINKVIQDKGGLHNRVTEVIRLLPFNLWETNAFLEHRGINLNPTHLLQLYMSIGGIPTYLNLVEPGMSSQQSIEQLFFGGSAFLVDEFKRLFASLFKDSRKHTSVVRALGTSSKALSRESLLKKAKLSDGGTGSTVLRELEESGFIQARPHLKNKKKMTHFFLIDEYCLFYLKWIDPLSHGRSVGNWSGWAQQAQSSSYRSWSGLAFEAVCFKHVPQIKSALGVSAVLTQEMGFFYTGSDDEDPGCQIDLVLQRADRVTNICEIKHSSDVINLSQDMAKGLEQKKNIFRQVSKSKDYLMMTLISTHGIKGDRVPHYIESQVTLEHLLLRD